MADVVEETARLVDKVLETLVLQVARDKLVPYWSDRWTNGEGDEISAWLLSMLDSDWTAADGL